MTVVQFLQGLANQKIKNHDRAVGLLWFVTIENVNFSLKASEINNYFSNAGYGKQNISRLKNSLKKDPRIVTASKGVYKINQKHRVKLDKKFFNILIAYPFQFHQVYYL